MKTRAFHPEKFIASVFGIGYIPFAPGTWGSLFAAGVYLLLPQSLFYGKGWWFTGIALLIFSLFSVWISTLAEKKLGADAPAIVIDEVCGYFVSVMFLPKSVLTAVYAFALFRVFDIAKPFPINVSQRLKGGWGIVLDDLLAGFYANVVIQFIKLMAPRFFGQ